MRDILHPSGKDDFVSRFWGIPGACLSTLRPDWMHIVDLGLLQSIQGCIFWELYVELGGNYTRRSPCALLLNMIKQQSRAQGVEPPINDLTVHMLRPELSKKPKMRLKAAEGRYLLPVLLGILLNCFEAVTPHQILRIQCVRALCDCYHLFTQWDSSSGRTLGQLARRHIILYKELHASATDKLLYVVAPKHHLFIHLSENAKANPITSWCYSEESLIGHAVKACSKMNRPHILRQLIPRFIQTYEYIV